MTLLVYSQVFLSAALPFSIFPLVYFTSNKEIMGEHVNAKWNTILRLSRCHNLNYLKFQFDCDNFYQIKKPALFRAGFLLKSCL